MELNEIVDKESKDTEKRDWRQYVDRPDYGEI
jgi:hypothetical protein